MELDPENERASTDPLDRYSRQIRFPFLREAGQRPLAGQPRHALRLWGPWVQCSRTIWLGRAWAVLRIVDRDFIEMSNLQRQVLFDEHDVAENLPKAEAAARKLRHQLSVTVEPVVTDIDRTNILELCATPTWSSTAPTTSRSAT